MSSIIVYSALGRYFLSRVTCSVTSLQYSYIFSFIIHLMFFSSLTATSSVKGIFDVLILPVCILQTLTLGSYAKQPMERPYR